MNLFNSFAKLLHLYCWFHKHQYWAYCVPYDDMAYGHISHTAIWARICPIWVSIETAIQLQQFGEGIKRIYSPGKKKSFVSKNVFLGNFLYKLKMLSTFENFLETLPILFCDFRLPTNMGSQLRSQNFTKIWILTHSSI